MSTAGLARLSAEAERLARLQTAFAAGILGADRAVLAHIRTGAPLGADERFGVYFAAYRARLRDALGDTYAHTARHLGDAAFGELVHEFIESHTPRRHSIRWYGEEFSAWLHAARPRHREVAELAALDWALRAAFDAADAMPLRAADLAALSPEQWDGAGFRLHPAFQLLELRYNTVALWHALDRDEPPPAPETLARPVSLLVWRRELQPHFRTLDDDEARALRDLHGGASFGAICASLAERLPQKDTAAIAGQWLARWIEEALLAGVR